MIIFIVLLILAAILIGGCLRFRYSFTCPADIIGRVIQNGFRLPPKKADSAPDGSVYPGARRSDQLL